MGAGDGDVGPLAWPIRPGIHSLWNVLFDASPQKKWKTSNKKAESGKKRASRLAILADVVQNFYQFTEYLLLWITAEIVTC